MTPTGSLTTYAGAAGSGLNYTICAGPDGNLWTTLDAISGALYKVTTSGSGTKVGGTYRGPMVMCSGPDGSMYSNYYDNISVLYYIIKMSITGTATIFGAHYTPSPMCVGSDGNLWVGDLSNLNIWRVNISTGGQTSFNVGSFNGTSPFGICNGPDGNLWFFNTASNYLVKMTTSGTVTNYSVSFVGPNGICAGPDGNLWATDFSGSTGYVWKITTSGSATSYSGFQQPDAICAGP